MLLEVWEDSFTRTEDIITLLDDKLGLSVTNKISYYESTLPSLPLLPLLAVGESSNILTRCLAQFQFGGPQHHYSKKEKEGKKDTPAVTTVVALNSHKWNIPD